MGQLTGVHSGYMWIAEAADDGQGAKDKVSSNLNETADQVQQSLSVVTVDGLITGAIIIAIVVVFALLVRTVMQWLLRNVAHRSESSARVLAKIVQWMLIIAGIGIALTYVFPSIKPVNLIGGLGVASVAAGIAFQTVLGNMFAGLVILWRQTPVVGDQIRIEGVAGTITKIDLSSTAVHTFDGRQVFIPNGVLHKSILTIQTHHDCSRTAFTVKIQDPANFARARDIAIAALADVPQVVDEPAPIAVLRQVTDGLATMEVRFWSGSAQFETVTALDAAILAVIDALTEANIAFGPANVVMMSGDGN